MIKKVEYIKDYQLRVTFNDSVVREIDLFSFMSQSTLPVIRQFLDIALFKTFIVDDWGLRWGDNEFDLNPTDIYNGIFDVGKEYVPYIQKKKSVTKKKTIPKAAIF